MSTSLTHVVTRESYLISYILFWLITEWSLRRVIRKSLCLPGLTLVVTLSFMHPPSYDIDHVPSLMKLKDMVRERLRDSPGPMWHRTPALPDKWDEKVSGRTFPWKTIENFQSVLTALKYSEDECEIFSYHVPSCYDQRSLRKWVCSDYPGNWEVSKEDGYLSRAQMATISKVSIYSPPVSVLELCSTFLQTLQQEQIWHYRR